MLNFDGVFVFDLWEYGVVVLCWMPRLKKGLPYNSCDWETILDILIGFYFV